MNNADLRGVSRSAAGRSGAQTRVDRPAEMDQLWNRYYKLNRIFLSPVGLWPYGNRKLKPIQAIVSVVILVSSVVTQLFKLFTTECDLDFILTDLSFAIPAMVYVVKYKSFYSQTSRLIRMMELIQDDWNSLTSEEEIHIVRKYMNTARRYIMVFTLIMCSMMSLFIFYCLLPNIFDFATTSSESHSREFPFLAEYFVDKQKHYNTLLTHIIVTLIVSLFVLVGTDTTFLANIYHIFGMFEVASYRMKHALDENIAQNSTIEWNTYVHARIITAVQTHQRAIQFFDYLRATINLSTFVVLCLGIASVSINLFRAAVLTMSKEYTVLMAIFISGQFYYMFLGNYVGQKIIDHSTHVFNETYDIPWYKASVQTQKLLLFVMQRSVRSCKVVLGGVYIVSLEGFVTLSSMSMSYFTLLRSTR